MSSLKDFQSQHGAEWSQLLGTPAFGAALALANSEKIQSILLLSDDEIATRGAIILSDLRGHLKYEAALLALHEKKELVFQGLGEEEYPDPIAEAAELAEQEQHDRGDEQHSSSGAFAGAPSAHEEIFPTPKKRGRPPGKKKLPAKRKPRKIHK